MPGSPNFAHAVVVDPNGTNANADFTTINDAIPEARSRRPSGGRATVLVNPGIYQENVLLGTADERVDLVGVDRGACIIAPSTGVGLTIESGPVSPRDHLIQGLTIATGTTPSSSHGIEIKEGPGGSLPKGIAIRDCTIIAPGTQACGILGAVADDLMIDGCVVESPNFKAMRFGRATTMLRSTFVGGSIGVESVASADQPDGVRAVGCLFDGAEKGLFLVGSPAANIEVRECTIRSKQIPLHTDSLKGQVLFVNNLIILDGEADSAELFAIRHDINNFNPIIVHQSDRILARSAGLGAVAAVSGEPPVQRYINCEIVVDGLHPNGGSARGVVYNPAPGSGQSLYEIVGGSIVVTSANEKQDVVYAIEVTSPTPNLRVEGVRFSQSFGPIRPSGPPQTQVQRILSVDAADADAILASVTIGSSEDTYDKSSTPAVQDPDTYRALKVTGFSITGTTNVYVVGKNLAGDAITERFTITSGTSTVTGKKPFAVVDKVIVSPTEPSASGSLTVGTTDKLGLSSPLSSTNDVLQWSKVSGSAWQIQSLSALTVDVNHATINPGTITTGDSFEFTYLTAG